MGGKQSKPILLYSDASQEQKEVLRNSIVKRIKELEGADSIDLRDLNEYIFLNHEKDYLRMTKKEMATIISETVTRQHIVLPNHVWFVRQPS